MKKWDLVVENYSNKLTFIKKVDEYNMANLGDNTPVVRISIDCLRIATDKDILEMLNTHLLNYLKYTRE